MSAWRLIVSGLFYHWRIHLAVALGVAASTAVLTGALLVGDSVRGSLREMALDRLGRIDQVLVTDRFFREPLASEIAAADQFNRWFAAATPVVLFPSGTVECPRESESTRQAGVLVIGCDERFWQLGREDVRPSRMPSESEIVLNEPLARQLAVAVGDQVLVRLSQEGQVPADSPLGRLPERFRMTEMTVIEIVPARGLGRFGLQASQQTSLNAYVAMSRMQSTLDQPGKVNTVLVSGKSDEPAGDDAEAALAEMLRPTFEDYGLAIKHVHNEFEGQTIVDYFSFSTDRMIVDDETASIAEQAFAADHGQPVFTYLANLIYKVDGDLPADEDPQPAASYSTVAAIDASTSFPLPELSDDEIVLNSWTAEDLEAEPGDTIRIVYFQPESTHGVSAETSHDFTLKAIVPLTEPRRAPRNRPAVYDKSPTIYNDADLTPEVKGVSDKESIDKWEAPFPVDYKRVRRKDDVYWKNHRTTPKAFVSVAAGQRLWGSRFGQVTSVRIPQRDGLTTDELKTRFLDRAVRDDATLGFRFIPIKAHSLRVSPTAQWFNILFISLSFFIIAAALMLVFLLFRLGVEQRASEIGTLLAVGFPRRRVGRVLIAEGLIVSLDGAALGVLIGVGYARLMLWGLTTRWVGAVATPFLTYHWTWLTIVLGYVLGIAVSLITIAWSIRRTRLISVRRLLSGQASEAAGLVERQGRLAGWLAATLLLAAGGLAWQASSLSGEAQAGAFVGSGAAVLTGLLIVIWIRLRGGKRSSGIGGLSRLATRNAGRNPSRSTLTIGLMATASFLIVAMSSFRMSPTEQGTGGFDLVATSSEPLFEDLNSANGRAELLADDANVLSGGAALSFRVQAGDDASCNNLYRASQPRVLGMTPAAIEYFDDPEVPQFAWSASDARTDAERANPWRILERPIEDDIVPVVIDKNTAMYSLEMYLGIGEEKQFTYDDGTTFRIRVVGLLSNTILQGSLITSDDHFRLVFPRVNGFRYFLIRSPGTAASQSVAQTLEDRLGDQGFDASSAAGLLEGLLAVQNTYLSTFQSLGALGLLLGTFGLATVQLRGILERRGELALMRAAGFRGRRLGTMVLLENVVLLLGGLSTGIFAALVAVLPHVLIGGANVPFADLGVMLAIVAFVGLVTGILAVRSALRAPLVSALRGE